MKVFIENLPQGALVCHINEPLRRSEADQIVLGIQKLLTNGKARIILDFNLESAAATGGASYLEKSVRKLRDLARKMAGDIVFVVPGAEGDRISGSVPDLNAALRRLLGRSGDLIRDHEDALKELGKKNEEVVKLTAENKLLIAKIQELLRSISKPSTDAELQAAVLHYQKLAAEAEAQSPKGTPKPTSQS